MTVDNWAEVRLINSYAEFRGNEIGGSGLGQDIYLNTNSRLVLENSTAVFAAPVSQADKFTIAADNSSMSFMADNSPLGSFETALADISFWGLSFEAGAGAGQRNVGLNVSQLWMRGNVRMDGGMWASQSTVSLSGGLWRLSGMNDFSGMKLFEIRSASMIVVGATYTYINSVGMNVDNAYVAFAGDYSSVTFSGNGARDIVMNAGSQLFFGTDGLIIFNNGLRVDGGKAYKTGSGVVLFEGEGTILPDFTISAGTVVFHASKSSAGPVALINSPASGAALSLQGGSTSTLFVLGDFSLNGVLALDFNFNSLNHTLSTNDFIHVAGDANILQSTLSANIVYTGGTIGELEFGSSLPFVSAASISGFRNLYIAILGYSIVQNNNVLWLVYGNSEPWDKFVSRYLRAAAGATVVLDEDIYA